MSENLHKFLKFLPSDFEFVMEVRNKKCLDNRCLICFGNKT